MAVRQGRRALTIAAHDVPAGAAVGTGSIPSTRTIAHVLPWPGIGGTEHATLRIARAAAERGYGNIAFYRQDSPVVGEFFRDAGLKTVPYALAELSVRRPLPFARNTLALRSAFRTHGVDLVHCADIDAALQVAPAGRLAGVPVLCHIRHPWTSMLRREALVLSTVGTFVFVSRDTWSTFAYRVGPARGRVLYDGIDVQPPPEPASRAEVRRELGIAEGVPVIGMTARVSGQKDYVTLARAAKRVLEVLPAARFVIVGDHERHAAHREHFSLVQRELERLGVAQAFVFTGFRSDVAQVMAAFDVFVLSTHFEGLPLVILEAMAMQLPVVATAVNGIPELITNDSVGLLAPHEDDETLARHLLALLGDPARARRVAAGGRELVERQFSARMFGENIAALYADALRGREFAGRER
jgi:glycosyltransferase involved in cell wall biosynthesis